MSDGNIYVKCVTSDPRVTSNTMANDMKSAKIAAARMLAGHTVGSVSDVGGLAKIKSNSMKQMKSGTATKKRPRK